MIRVQVSLKNEFGEFLGEVLEVSEEQYQTIVDLSKRYYETGFEMTSEDGGFLIFPPDIVKKSVLKISIKDVQKEI